MSSTFDQLSTQAIALSPSDRARLADLLHASLPEDLSGDLDAAWDHEIRARIDALESGTTVLVASTQVHEEARKIYQR
jgi:putative addiction module component (TIGR02574 family)